MTTLFKNISGKNPHDVICVVSSVLAHSVHNFPCTCTCSCILFAVTSPYIRHELEFV